MPLTPAGSPGGMEARAAMVFGGVVALLAMVAGPIFDMDLLTATMLGGFGLLMAAWGGLMGQRGHPRLLLAMGAVGGLAAFAAALALAMR